MKVKIKLVTINKELSQDQLNILRRISNVLELHDFGVAIEVKEKKTIKPEEVKLKKII